MFRDQIQKQPTVRASLLVCTRRCHTLINTHKTSHARKHTHARTHVHAHARTHTHTRPHYFQLLSVSLSMPPEVSFLSFQRPFHVQLGYPQKNGLKRCTTGKKNSQILFSLASFLLMSSCSCKRMSMDQIQKQPTVRASLLVGTRRCHKLYAHAQNIARTHARTHTRSHWYTNPKRTRAHTLARAYTHTTHTTTLFPIALCLPLSATREAFTVPSTYRPGPVCMEKGFAALPVNATQAVVTVAVRIWFGSHAWDTEGPAGI